MEEVLKAAPERVKIPYEVGRWINENKLRLNLGGEELVLAILKEGTLDEHERDYLINRSTRTNADIARYINLNFIKVANAIMYGFVTNEQKAFYLIHTESTNRDLHKAKGIDILVPREVNFLYKPVGKTTIEPLKLYIQTYDTAYGNTSPSAFGKTVYLDNESKDDVTMTFTYEDTRNIIGIEDYEIVDSEDIGRYLGKRLSEYLI